jgi:DNA ligase (NAD+)
MESIKNKTKTTKTKKMKTKLKIIEVDESSPKNLTLKSNTRCKNGTKKYKPLGLGCYTEEEINNHKLFTKLNKNNATNAKTKPKTKSNAKTKKMSEIIILDEPPIELTTPIRKRIEPKLSRKKVSNKRHLKIPSEIKIMETKRYNEEFIELMEKLSNIMLKQGEPFRARAYQKAQETIMTFPDDITSPSQLKGKPNIGSTIMDKLNEYVETGTLRVLEKEKNNPINILGEIYGVGPKKAQELVDSGIKTIDELREKQDELLNDTQKVGLKYYEQILERIPRSEIIEYDHLFNNVFANSSSDDKFEIVGSYRRGAQTSGDIDVIITGKTGAKYKKFIDDLVSSGIILEVLSRGPSKTLVIAKLPSKSKTDESRVARRIDFLYTPPDEFAFAILYFTGSKIFNTVMRQYGLNKGYTFNEHGIYHLENKKKRAIVNKEFKTEKDIFDFLGLQFKAPTERTDGRAVVPYTDVGEKSVAEKPVAEEYVEEEMVEFIPVKKNKTVKKRTAKKELGLAVNTNKDETEIIAFIDDFKNNGITVLENLNEKQLEDIIRVSNEKYYNQTPAMTDNQYDIVKEYIEQKYPNNAVINEIGAEVERNKVKLPYEMASMDKIKPDTNALGSWKKKYTGPYVLSCKLDGVSGLYTTEGKVPKLYTRGDGKVGQDVSHLIPFLRLPKTKNIVIRGEFILPKAIFEEKYKTKFANPRNMVAGIINHKHISDEVVDLHFVAYEVIVPQKKPSEQMSFLETINVKSVLFNITDNLTNELLSDMLVDLRKSYEYEIDGIIVTNDKLYPRKSGNPDHSFAFKMVLSDQIAEAKVVDVIWTPSKDGYLKPRVQIEPINLGGVKIEYATGFNGAFIKDNLVGIGATIALIRSGDVIPHIKSVIVPAEHPKMPSVPFKWNETHVDIMLENLSEDPIVKEKNITGFFRGIEVEGLSAGNIARLIKAGYDTVPKIIHMKEADYLQVDGFKSKMANKIYTGIRDKLKEASIITLMSASNIFGRGFSDKKMELILSDLPDILVSDDSKEKKIKEITLVKGMAIKTAEAFVEKIDDFKNFLIDCGLEDKMYETPANKKVDQSHPLFGKTVVLTGTRDKDVIEFLKNVGANQGSSVSKNTHLVIAKNKDEDTGKAEEARKLNIPVMSVQEFTQTYLNK